MTTPEHVETPSKDWDNPFGVPGPNDLIAEPTESEPHVVTGEAPYRPLLIKAAEPEATASGNAQTGEKKIVVGDASTVTLTAY